MARKRASKKRVDYRKGGRVSVRTGGRQFGELDAIMTGRGGKKIPKQKNPTTPKPSNEEVVKRGQIDQSKIGTPSAEESARLDALNKVQSGAVQGVNEQVGGIEGTGEAQVQSAPFRNKARTATKVDKRGRTIQVGETGRGRMGQYNNPSNLSETVELTDEQQAEVDKVNAEAEQAAKDRAAAEAADPTKNDPARELMGRVGTEDNPTYTPTKPDVSKLNVGAVTEQSSDADKLKAGISTDVQQLATDGTMPQIADPTKVSADRPFASQGTAGSAATPDRTDANTYEADRIVTFQPATEAAQGEVSKIAEAEGPEFRDRNRVETARRDALAEEQAMAQKQDFTISDDAFVDKVTGRVAEVVQTDPAEKQQREVQLGMPAPDGEAAQIINEFGFGNSMKPRLVQGAKAKQAAADKLASDHDLDPEVANQIMEDVEGFKIEGQSQESLGAVAALPKEALVSTQMENLVAGMEEGKPPSWARPAIAAVEQMMAQRGLSASSVGRDALFNAIIQSAMPIAQSNATALQQRAAQNLSNEQQALIQDRQIAASFLEKNAAFKQQMELANLTNDQQMRLANLTSRNQNESENLSAAQQTEMANLNARLQTNLTSAKIAADMNQAQLSVDQQRAVQNAAMVARVDMTKFNAAQQVELANSKFMQNATLADFNARQQSAMQNATTMATMDLAAADQQTKLAITNANNFLQMDMANLNNRQQATILDQQLKQQRMLSNQAAANAAKQFNATSKNQTDQFFANMEANMNQFNTSQANAMEQFNIAESNRMKAINAQNNLEAQKFNTQMNIQVDQFNANIENQRDIWNAQNAQAVEQSNIEWRRKANTIDTAAQNAANQLNAQQAFAISSAEQNFIWQEMRDQSAYLRQAYENDQQRRTTLYATAIANETSVSEKSKKTPDQLVSTIDGIINRGRIG